MIVLTKLNDTPFALNDDLIETIEEVPDTTIRLISKNYIIVKESMMEVITKVIEFRRETNGTIALRRDTQQNFHQKEGLFLHYEEKT